MANLHEHFSTVAKVYRELRNTDEAPIRFIRDQLAGLASIRGRPMLAAGRDATTFCCSAICPICA